MDDVRIIGFFNLTYLFAWVDESYALHPTMRIQKVGLISTGFGMLHFLFNKQNPDEKSSTKAEIIGTINYDPFNIWMVMFLEDQRYEIKINIIFQKN